MGTESERPKLDKLLGKRSKSGGFNKNQSISQEYRVLDGAMTKVMPPKLQSLYACTSCDSRFAKRSKLKIHAESVHKEKSHSNATFVTTTVLKRVT